MELNEGLHSVYNLAKLSALAAAGKNWASSIKKNSGVMVILLAEVLVL